MVYEKLTKYEKMRFKSNNICKICKTIIHNTDSFELLKTKCGKSYIYSFFHTDCIYTDIDTAKFLLNNSYGLSCFSDK